MASQNSARLYVAVALKVVVERHAHSHLWNRAWSAF